MPDEKSTTAMKSTSVCRFPTFPCAEIKKPLLVSRSLLHNLQPHYPNIHTCNPTSRSPSY
eukprot:1587668-Pleurochrysis_carterae.AAC.1